MRDDDEKRLLEGDIGRTICLGSVVRLLPADLTKTLHETMQPLHSVRAHHHTKISQNHGMIRTARTQPVLSQWSTFYDHGMYYLQIRVSPEGLSVVYCINYITTIFRL